MPPYVRGIAADWRRVGPALFRTVQLWNSNGRYTRFSVNNASTRARRAIVIMHVPRSERTVTIKYIFDENVFEKRSTTSRARCLNTGSGESFHRVLVVRDTRGRLLFFIANRCSQFSRKPRLRRNTSRLKNYLITANSRYCNSQLRRTVFFLNFGPVTR